VRTDLAVPISRLPEVVDESYRRGDASGLARGLGNRQYASLEHGESLALMKQIKDVFDPHGILNPGKIWE